MQKPVSVVMSFQILSNLVFYIGLHFCIHYTDVDKVVFKWLFLTQVVKKPGVKNKV